MTNKKSIIKRIKTTERNRLQNKSYKTALKNSIKKCLLMIKMHEGDQYHEIDECLSFAYSKIDKAIKIGAIHKNNGARKKSYLNKQVYQLKTNK
uniref:Small ribosomal subunit protein bS20c n=1 Tax=Bulboplastis apyrenoidosa TaxID=1070855 RepID=A0A1Y9TM64_9RHOD|nr:30S ribosomal protein S20 [Bulboplastis apyrenoidosa]ARO90748.1 30S ribosomal protein S20 [Bulboplastis apyrenoidosa]